MRWLIFLSKVAFLSGITMALAFSLAIVSWNGEEPVSSSIILAGYGLSMIMLPLVNICYLVLWLLGKKPATLVPRRLLIANILFILLLATYLFYLNDSFYHQG